MTLEAKELNELNGPKALRAPRALKALREPKHGAMTGKGTSQIRLRTADETLPEIKQARVTGTASELNLGVAIKPVARQTSASELIDLMNG